MTTIVVDALELPQAVCRGQRRLDRIAVFLGPLRRRVLHQIEVLGWAQSLDLIGDVRRRRVLHGLRSLRDFLRRCSL